MRLAYIIKLISTPGVTLIFNFEEKCMYTENFFVRDPLPQDLLTYLGRVPRGCLEVHESLRRRGSFCLGRGSWSGPHNPNSLMAPQQSPVWRPSDGLAARSALEGTENTWLVGRTGYSGEEAGCWRADRCC